MTIRFSAIASLLLALFMGGCSGLWGYDEYERYTQRSDSITMSAGNAKRVNAVTHMYDPWPPGVGDRQILADGVRMQRALDRYRRGAQPPDPMPKVDVEGLAPFGKDDVPTEPPGPEGSLSSLPKGSSVNVPVGGGGGSGRGGGGGY
jgi:hypothetical protein